MLVRQRIFVLVLVRTTLPSPILDLPKVATCVLHLKVIQRTIFLFGPQDGDRCHVNVAHQCLTEMIKAVV
jgi:hypothetical protein